MSKVTEMAEILEHTRLADGIYSMWILTDAALCAKSGQFVSLYCKEQSRLLPRPISICEIDRERKALRLVYRVVGKGTNEFCQYKKGDKIKILAPLGNGFLPEGEKPILVGGGIGVPPMLQLAKELPNAPTIVLGYRDSRLFLKEEFEAQGKVIVATDDGSVGIHGTVVDAMKQEKVTGDVMFACGPKPMLAAVKEFAKENGIRCYISMEERMACGVGACLGCVCQTKDVDAHSHVHNARICKDGPVFLAEEVELS